MAAIRPTDRFRLRRLPVRCDDRHPLLGCYLELVWAEVLGVTATAVARRLGHHLADDAHAVSLDAIARPLAVPTTRVVQALRRLHHQRLIVFDEASAVIATSAHIPSVPPGLLAALSAYTRRRSAAFPTECEPAHR